MHIVFLTHYFPPESNAPAVRTFENAKRWVGWGHRVTVITCAPNHPDGILYPGYRNRFRQWDEIDGIGILRVITFLSANAGFFKRTLNYVSFMLSAVLFCGRVKDVDMVISTSPQFFCGMAGYFVSRMKRRPWILEIRDLWPASIEALGAIRHRTVIRLLERLERFLYRKADHTVSLTQSFKNHIAGKGVRLQDISVITNGADLKRFSVPAGDNSVREMLNLNGKFIISYIGTLGMAHGLHTILRAADLLKSRADILFLIMGNGAERDSLLREKEARALENVLILPQQPIEKVPGFIAASDACAVLLRKKDIFKTVIPSKIFEAMAMARPIILGVEGECRQVVEKANCAVFIDPEDHDQLARAALQLHHAPGLCSFLGQNGRSFVREHFDREKLAWGYLNIVKRVHVAGAHSIVRGCGYAGRSAAGG